MFVPILNCIISITDYFVSITETTGNKKTKMQLFTIYKYLCEKKDLIIDILSTHIFENFLSLFVHILCRY